MGVEVKEKASRRRRVESLARVVNAVHGDTLARLADRQGVGVPFLALRHGQCKFPLGAQHDAPEGFCGEVAETAKPYCPRHCAVAYIRRPPRR